MHTIMHTFMTQCTGGELPITTLHAAAPWHAPWAPVSTGVGRWQVLECRSLEDGYGLIRQVLERRSLEDGEGQRHLSQMHLEEAATHVHRADHLELRAWVEQDLRLARYR